MPKARGLSAYLLFTEEHRAQVTEELKQQGGDGAKISVAQVAKVLGQRWKTLTEDDKRPYLERAAASAAEKAAAAEQEGVGEGAPADDAAKEQEQQQAGHQPHTGLPLSLVRKIIMCDTDVVRASKDSVLMLAMCGELLIELLTSQASEAARRNKRKTIRLEEFQEVVKRDKRMVDMGLKDIANDEEMYAKNNKQALPETEDNDENMEAPAANRLRGKAAKGPACVTKDISSFFKSG